jgi:hypothetical protein
LPADGHAEEYRARIELYRAQHPFRIA